MTDYIYIIIGMSTSFVLCIAVLLFFIKYRKNILQQKYQLKIAEIEHQKQLIHSIITSQEQERKRIGMDLHDEIGASLSAIKLMLQMNANVTNELDDVIKSVRGISHNLFPTIKGEMGFSDALHEYTHKISLSDNLQVDLNFESDEAETFLKNESALAIYRVITELITNSIKHGRSSEISVDFSFINDEYVVDYRDNGEGNLPEKLKNSRGMGFSNISSRLGMLNATMVIEDPEVGCHIRLKLPAHD